MKILKKAMSFLLSAAMLIAALPAAADSNSGADVIVSDIEISNPYYEVGDLIYITLHITNIGDEAMKLGSAMIQNIEGLTAHGSTWMWSRPTIFPGETIRFVLNAPYEVTSETISFRGRCNSAAQTSTEPAVNQGNNYLDVTFTPVRETKDLVIRDISVRDLNFAEGNVETFEIEYQNAGIEDIPYGTVEVKFTVNGKSYTLKDVSSVQSREIRKIKSEGIYVEGEKAEVTANININASISEDNYDNNIFTKTFGATKAGKYDYKWTELRLGGGGWVRDMFIHPKFEDELFIGTDVNGVYRFNPYTRTNEQLFACMDKEYEDSKFFMEMVADYNNPNIMFCAGGNHYNGSGTESLHIRGGLHRTFDGGKSWEHIPTPFEYGGEVDGTNGLIAVDPNDTNILYSGTSREGLWKTENALGRSVKWQRVNLPGYTYDYADSESSRNSGKSVGTILFDEKSEIKNGKTQVFYVAADNIGIYKTTDGGNSFTIIEGSPVYKYNNLILDAEGRLVLSCQDAGIYRYEDGEWTDITPVSSRVDYRMDVNPNDANMIAASAKSTLFFTKDGGVSWKEVFKTSTLTNKIPWHEDSFHKESLGFVRFDPHNKNRMFYGAWFGAYETTDITADNVVWEDITYGIEELCAVSLTALPEEAKGDLIFGVCDVGCVKVDDLYEFPTIHVNEPFMQDTTEIDYCEKHPEFVARVGNYLRDSGAGRAAYSTDYGDTWTSVTSYPLKEDGVTWAENGKIAVASDYNENGVPTMIVTTVNDASYRSTDKGETWTKISTLPENMITMWMNKAQPIASDRVNKDVFYAFDLATGNFYTSYNNGESFSLSNKLPIGDTYSRVIAVPDKEGHIYVSLNGNGLYRSDDYGKTFTKINGVSVAYGFDVGAKAPCSENETLFVLGTVNGNEGVFRSTDLGESWVKINDEKQHTLYARVEFIEADKHRFGVVYVASHGSGIIIGYPSQLDLEKPRVGIYNEINGKTTNIKNYEITGGSTKPGTAYITLNGTQTELTLDENNRYSHTLNLNEGENTIKVYALDTNGKKSNEVNYTLNYDPEYVGLTLSADAVIAKEDVYTISGFVDTDPKEAVVYIDDTAVAVDKQTGSFEKVVSLDYGENVFTVKASNKTSSEVKEITVNYDLTPPGISFINLAEATSDPLLILEAKLNEPGIIQASGNEYSVNSADETVKIPFSLADGENTLEFKLTDMTGNSCEHTEKITLNGDERLKQLKSNEVVAYSGTAVIDGTLEDGWILNRVISKKASGDSKVFGRYGLMADSKYLYVGVKMYDDTVSPGGSDVANNYTTDNIEIYIDVENDKEEKYGALDQQIRLGLVGIPYACTRGVAAPNVKTKTSTDKNGYIIEAAIPWSEISIDYKEGASFGFEIAANDSNDGGNSRDGVVCWIADGNSYRNTSKFGTAYIMRK